GHRRGGPDHGGEVRGGVSLPGLPPPVSGGAEFCPVPRLLYAEVLRLYLQRGGPLYGGQAEKEGPLGAGILENTPGPDRPGVFCHDFVAVLLPEAGFFPTGEG